MGESVAIEVVVLLVLALLACWALSAVVLLRQQKHAKEQLKEFDAALQKQVFESEKHVQRLQQELEYVRNQLMESKTANTRLDQQLQTVQASAAEMDRLNSALEEKVVQLSKVHELLQKQEALGRELTERNSRLSSQLETEQQNYQQQIELLKQAKSELSKEFENLANRIFTSKQEQFQQSSKVTLESSIGPLKSQLAEFRQKVEDVYAKENADRNKLAGHIDLLHKQTQKISEEANNLANALKGDNKAQGNWGEVVLERVLEESGLQKGREYEVQVSLKSDVGDRRSPDVIVRLPENKDIVIDAKVSLVDYERFCSAVDQAEKDKALKQHVVSLRNHINGLSVKSYEKLEGIRTLDFVFIFVPIEAAFMAALQYDPTLFKDAYDKHVIVVSPTTLLATLRTVENIWRNEKQNRNADLIATRAGGLYDQFVLVVEAVDDIGKSLDRAHQSYEKAQARMQTGRGNVLRRIEELKKLGAKTKKSIEPSKLQYIDDDMPEED